MCDGLGNAKKPRTQPRAKGNMQPRWSWHIKIATEQHTQAHLHKTHDPKPGSGVSLSSVRFLASCMLAVLYSCSDGPLRNGVAYLHACTSTSLHIAVVSALLISQPQCILAMSIVKALRVFYERNNSIQQVPSGVMEMADC
jgi:hypothetical protein